MVKRRRFRKDLLRKDDGATPPSRRRAASRSAFDAGFSGVSCPFAAGALPAEPFGMREPVVAAAAVVFAFFAFPSSSARAAEDQPSSSLAPSIESPSKAGADRLTLSLGAPAIGGLWVDGNDGHSLDGASGGTSGLSGGVEYGHVFASWMELGVGFEAQHRIGSSLGAYRPYGFVRAFATLPDAEIGVGLRAGPTWFHFDVEGDGETLLSVAPSAVIDARVWISPRVALVGSLEALVSGARVQSSGAPGYVDGSQVWNVTTIASLGVSFRL